MAKTAVIGIEVRDYMIDAEMGITPSNEKQITELKAEIESKKKQLNDKKNELEEKNKSITTLISTNQKLRKGIKDISLKLDKTIVNAKARIQKIESKSSQVTDSRFANKEIEDANRLIKKYQKDIIALKQKLDTSAAYDRYNELENKYKELDAKYKEYEREKKTLKAIQNDHEKTIGSFPKNNSQYDEQIIQAKSKLKTITEENNKLKAESEKQHQVIQESESKYRQALEQFNKKIYKEDESYKTNEEERKHKEEIDAIKKEQSKIVTEYSLLIKEKQIKKALCENKLKEIKKVISFNRTFSYAMKKSLSFRDCVNL